MDEAYEYGLMRETYFVARPVEVVAVAGLLWIYFVFLFFVSLRTRPAASTCDATLPHLPLY